MANEIYVSFSLKYNDTEDTTDIPFLQLLESAATISSKKFVKGKRNIGTSEEAIPLATEITELGSLGWAAFKNLDTTNYVELRSATGSSNDIIKIPAGKGCLFYFGSDITAPYIIANTAACQVAYLILAQ